jgi:branched-subunit amino acid aminotransferase/4-amino-4-deoxychorismate lyase
VDIKTTSLLPNVLAKQAAREAGAFEAWFVDGEGRVTEGSSSNAWIVTTAGDVVTPPADGSILEGVTRTGIIELVKGTGRRIVERRFTVAEAKTAREAFLSSATTIVMPVVEIDGALGFAIPLEVLSEWPDVVVVTDQLHGFEQVSDAHDLRALLLALLGGHDGDHGRETP